MSGIEYNEDQLDGFRQTQGLAYECADAIAAELEPGVTESEVAQRMEAWLLDHGVDDWFHRPFAWFGDRTAFYDFEGIKHMGGFNPMFYPGDRQLETGMPFILDCAPSMQGYTADIGYSGVVGENAVLDKLMDDLLDFRRLIVDQVKQRRPLSEISQAVDRLCAEYGYDPCHKCYPFATLAHRVEQLPDDSKPSHTTVMHFGLRNLLELGKDRFKGGKEGWSPIWNSSKSSDHTPTPGLWAVEPHLGFRGATGAKWEELLVVTEDDAFWLDDDIPHVRRWQQRGLWTAEAATA